LGIYNNGGQKNQTKILDIYKNNQHQKCWLFTTILSKNSNNFFLAIYNNFSNWEDSRANRWVSLDSELELGQGKAQDGGRT
jgi:hypothetical protein